MSLFNYKQPISGLMSKGNERRDQTRWVEVDGYTGPDRRRKQQREAADRRTEWRHELAKWPRRSGAGRRLGEHINLWYKDLCG